MPLKGESQQDYERRMTHNRMVARAMEDPRYCDGCAGALSDGDHRRCHLITELEH